jgi:hypothetical protein
MSHNEFLTGTEGSNNPAEQMPEEGDHASKSYRNRRQCSVHSGRKLFISRGRKVLISHTESKYPAENYGTAMR